ncbi:subtilisin-like protease SBT4.3 [Impatiens glandulifera]|uniref:subtilisin-like protease SBT4.3 n=1 Tax=Impatiens glandulifera TaxID=253017 RepID=UPI001FB17C61|nr:subtilisin-like protease SBT4.3 [Impatiens glandulifera]
MGFPYKQYHHRNPTLESNIIIGHLDSGVLFESESFSDYGLSHIPKKWKASIVAGNPVKNVSFFGIANGTARGGVESARIATYTVCSNLLCDDHNVLAGFDDAIADNVDIITISISYDTIKNMSDDVIAIGSFHAIQNDILTVNAAGNNGIHGLGWSNGNAPWIFTVAASADRKILNKLILGNGRSLISTSVNSFDESNHSIRLVYGKSVSNHCNESFARQCNVNCVDPHLVKGKILVCDSLQPDVITTAGFAGASGVIFRQDQQSEDEAIIVSIPTAILNESDFRYIESSYLKSKVLHSARITKSDIIKNHIPILASLSSRGPNTILPQIFKPDITAPGINILAAYPPKFFYASPIKNFHSLYSNYSFLSGTSMACPHVAGAVAYVKSKHPDWSASAIKSSLMTSARNMNGEYNLNAELGHGSGHIDPVKAAYPGLVYETFIDDYFKMFCSLGSEGDKLKNILKGKKKCPKRIIRTYAKDLNYPAMTASIHENSFFTIQFSRIVTNVGHANSTYHAEISGGDNTVYVSVEPNVLSFVHLKQRKPFTVTVNGQWLNQDHISCSLIWFDVMTIKPNNVSVQEETNIIARSPVIHTHNTHDEKPKMFSGVDFKRWEHKMLFYLTTLNLVRFLIKDALMLQEGESSVESISVLDAWKHSDFLCQNYILNGLVDSLSNVYFE